MNGQSWCFSHALGDNGCKPSRGLERAGASCEPKSGVKAARKATSSKRGPKAGWEHLVYHLEDLQECQFKHQAFDLPLTSMKLGSVGVAVEEVIAPWRQTGGVIQVRYEYSVLRVGIATFLPHCLVFSCLYGYDGPALRIQLLRVRPIASPGLEDNNTRSE